MKARRVGTTACPLSARLGASDTMPPADSTSRRFAATASPVPKTMTVRPRTRCINGKLSIKARAVPILLQCSEIA